jgi:hypothetical protein
MRRSNPTAMFAVAMSTLRYIRFCPRYRRLSRSSGDGVCMIRSNGFVIALLAIPVVACPLVFHALRDAHAEAAAPTSSTASAPAESPWVVPDIDKLPDDDWGRTVRYGSDLVAKTASLIGPEVSDPAHRFVGNNLNCQSCHLKAGAKAVISRQAARSSAFPTSASTRTFRTTAPARAPWARSRIASRAAWSAA